LPDRSARRADNRCQHEFDFSRDENALHFLKKVLQLVFTEKGSSIKLLMHYRQRDRRAKDGEL
jgi:hypothetical protein